MAGSKNRRFSRFIRQINEDLTIKTRSLETEAQVTTSTVSTQVDSAINQLIGGAPESLNTLNELADALNDDQNFASTITNSLANKLNADSALQFNLDIQPEILEIQVDAPDSGHGNRWLWTWEQSTLPYARATITNSPQINVPLYEQGTYVVNNYAYSLHGDMNQTHSLKLKWIDGAGDDNLVSWVTYDSVSASHPDIDSGNTHTIQQLSISVPSNITPPTLTAPNVSYTISNSGSGAYTFTGTAHGSNPNIGPLRRGGTYTFNVNASGHPLYLTTDNGTNFVSGSYVGEYVHGVTNSRTDNGTLTFVVPDSAPDVLYYQCGNHSPMRGVVTIKDLEVETNISGRYVVYFQHSQEGHKQAVELKAIPSLVNQMCLVYDNTLQKFVPQDLATYVDNTPSFKEKIKEVAGTATLIAPDGVPVVATVSIVSDATYLPIINNDIGDLAYSEDTQTMYVWSGTAWNATRPPSENSYLQLSQEGVLEVTTGTTRWTAPKDITISSVKAVLGTAPSGSDMTASLNRNGTSINSITISDGNTTATNSSLSLSVSTGDYLTVDIDSAGGSDLNLIIAYT